MFTGHAADKPYIASMAALGRYRVNARIGDGAHLVNEAGVERADGDGFFIRDA